MEPDDPIAGEHGPSARPGEHDDERLCSIWRAMDRSGKRRMEGGDDIWAPHVSD